MKRYQNLQLSWIQRSYWQCFLTELQYSRSSYFHLSHCHQRFQNHCFSCCKLYVSCACSSEAQWKFENHQHFCALFCLYLCISSQAFELQTDESNRLNDVHLYKENILKIIAIDDDAIDCCQSLKDFCNDDWFYICSAHDQCTHVYFLAWLIAQSLLSSIVLFSLVAFEVSSWHLTYSVHQWCLEWSCIHLTMIEVRIESDVLTWINCLCLSVLQRSFKSTWWNMFMSFQWRYLSTFCSQWSLSDIVFQWFVTSLCIYNSKHLKSLLLMFCLQCVLDHQWWCRWSVSNELSHWSFDFQSWKIKFRWWCW